MQHLLHEDAAHDLGRFDVMPVLDRVQGAEVGRQRSMLDLQRPPQVPTQALDVLNRHSDQRFRYTGRDGAYGVAA
jgi:hypothetical protein